MFGSSREAVGHNRLFVFMSFARRHFLAGFGPVDDRAPLFGRQLDQRVKLNGLVKRRALDPLQRLRSKLPTAARGALYGALALAGLRCCVFGEARCAVGSSRHFGDLILFLIGVAPVRRLGVQPFIDRLAPGDHGRRLGVGQFRPAQVFVYLGKRSFVIGGVDALQPE